MTLGVIGDIVEDVVVLAGAPFAAASDTPSHIVRRRGGSGANVAMAAASLVETRFIGCVGDDLAGRRLSVALMGLDVRLQTTAAAATGTVVVLVGADGERHMFPDRGANTHLRTVPPDCLNDLTVLHVTAYSLDGGSTPAAVTGAMRRLRGRVTSLDMSSQALLRQFGTDECNRLIERLDPAIVFANTDEAAVLGWSVEAPSPRRVIVVKHGGAPALVRAPGGAWTVPIERQHAADTTGAGDAFAAGALAHVVKMGLTRDDLLKCGETTAAAIVLAGHHRAVAWLTRRT